jgi:hypothetical protein
MWLLTVALAACYAPNPPGGVPCGDPAQCPNGQECVTGECKLICPAGWDSRAFGCYIARTDQKTWQEARDKCIQLGGDLTVIDDDAERDDVLSILDQDVWVGATDTAKPGSWTTVKGGPAYIHWAPGQPDGGDQHCLYVNASDTLFHDRACTDLTRSVCEL